jgi:hypothetical protein
MSRRRGTEEERRRKAALFTGAVESTIVHGVVIVLQATRRGRNCYCVMVKVYAGFGVSGKLPCFCRTLADADAVIAKLEREAHIAAAAKALGVV